MVISSPNKLEYSSLFISLMVDNIRLEETRTNETEVS